MTPGSNGARKSTPSPELDIRPSDLSTMSAPEIQAEMMKWHSGPAFVISPIPQFVRVAEASNQRFHITDNLDDIVDDEEDDAWKQWGKKSMPSSELNLRPSGLSAMFAPEIQAEMMKRHSRPAFVGERK
jgi:hypothetical protein